MQGLTVNDKKAVETFYKENYNMVQSLIINNNGSADDAKRHIPGSHDRIVKKCVPDPFELNCLIKTYVYSVSKRLWLKRLQQLNRYSPPIDDLESPVPVDEDMEDHEKRC